LDFKVLFVHPSDNGLKAYTKVDEKIYFITFETKKNNAEFTVYSENQKDKLLKKSKLRQEMLSKFMLFLKQHKEEIKVGIYFDRSKETYDKIFKLNSLEKGSNGQIDVSFSVLDDQYSISNLIVLKKQHQVFIDESRASFKHINPKCFCENIKYKHEISNFEHCLVLIEHLDTFLEWIKEEYKKKFMPSKTNNIIQFPAN